MSNVLSNLQPCSCWDEDELSDSIRTSALDPAGCGPYIIRVSSFGFFCRPGYYLNVEISLKAGIGNCDKSEGRDFSEVKEKIKVAMPELLAPEVPQPFSWLCLCFWVSD